MTTRTKVTGALVAALALMMGMRLIGQLGSSSPPPDPDLILAHSLAEDLGMLRDTAGLVAVEQTDRDSRASLYNSAHILRAMRLVGMPTPRPDDEDLASAVHDEAPAVDPLWAWEWACDAAGGRALRVLQADTNDVVKRLKAVLSAPAGQADEESRAGSFIDAVSLARCLGLKGIEASARDRLASTRTFTAEQLVRVRDLGVSVPRSSLRSGPVTSTAGSTTGDKCRGWDFVQGPAAWVLGQVGSQRPTPPTCLTQPAAGVMEPQAVYWLARAGTHDPAVRAAARAALGPWRSKLLASGLVSDAPVAQGSLQSSVIAAQLFASLGALDETPAWLRDVFIRRSSVAASSSSTGPPAGDSSGRAEAAVTQHRDSETILVALGCRAIASSCQRVVDAASAILRRPLPAEIRTGGQARQWIMVTDARTRLGLDTTESAKVDSSRDTWTQRGAVRARLAAALCQLGQCATGDAMGTGEPIDQARQALDAGQLELAMALLRLKGARQDRVSLADLSPVTSPLGRFRAAGTSAMFSWTPGGAPSVAATQSVYDAALVLGLRASDIVSAATAPTTAAPGPGSSS